MIANILLPDGTTRRLRIPEAWPRLKLPIPVDDPVAMCTLLDSVSPAPTLARWELSCIDYDSDRREAWYA